MPYRALATRLCCLLTLFVLGACGPEPLFVDVETTIESRGVDIPVTFVRPGSVMESVPLVVLVHGHGGTRDESGAFRRMADELRKKGIASIRMDFPGCGESSEPFTENNLTNMLADIRAARAFAAEHQRIDPMRIGILGYSMGGRLAMLATAQDLYSSVVLWAPVALNGSASVQDYVGGQEAYERLEAEARESGSAIFETPYGAAQDIGLQWFTDLSESQPLSVIELYEGALLVLYGNRDETIGPRHSRQVIASAVRSRPKLEYVVDAGGHGLGFYDDVPAMANAVVTATTRFFVDNL